MPAAITDKLRKYKSLFSTTLSTSIGTGTSDTITPASVTGLPTDTAITLTFDRVDSGGVATPTKLERIRGIISGGNFTAYVRGKDGTTEQAHTAGAVIEMIWNADDLNDMVDWANTQHNQDGTHGAITSTNASMVTASMVTPTINAGKFITSINDANGNEVIKTPATASAVNEVTVTNSATGQPVQVSATGDDTNIDLKLDAKGTGGIKDKNDEYLSPNYSMARQAIINGNFDVWQRGTSYNSGYTDSSQSFLADRWADRANDDGGTRPTLTRSRQALTTGELTNSFYFSRLNTNGAGTSLGVNSYHRYEQQIEHGTRLLCGNGKTVTLSFWARSDIANKRICPTIFQNYGSGGSPSTLEVLTGTVITLTSTLTKYTQTFTTNTLTGKTFGTANDDSLWLNFYTSWGTTHGNTYVQASVTAETYVGSGNIDIAQVQLCAGDVALPFQPKSFEEELRACMRYYEKSYNYETAPATNTTVGLYQGGTTVEANGKAWLVIPYKVTKRVTATVSVWTASGTASQIEYSDNGAAYAATANYGVERDGSNSFAINKHTETAGQAGSLAFHWASSAEL